ncbi:hypothetical protein BGZ73_008700, partial [Actinomortierella ambigua]
QPVRFGERSPPEILIAGNIQFPLYVSKNNGRDSSSETKIPVFSMVNPDVYPESKKWDDYAQRGTKWDRLFGASRFYSQDVDEITPIVAKHAKHIRCLFIRSSYAFNIFEPVCRQLTTLYCGVAYARFDRSMNEARILDFVKLQTNLQSISLPYFSVASSGPLVRLDRNWRDFGAMLNVQDFGDIHSLLPNTRTVRVKLGMSGDHARLLRLSRPHWYLNELQLRVNRFDQHMLSAIIESFPNLRRLTVKRVDDYRDQFKLDLILDNGYAMLSAVQSPTWDVFELIPVLPNLLVFFMVASSEPPFDLLAKHCPQLMYCWCKKRDQDRIPFVPCLQQDLRHDFEVLRTTPEKSITRLLASCQELVGVYCDQWSIQLEDIVSEPWVCHKLKSLGCVFSGVPVLSDFDQMDYRKMLKRRRKRMVADQQHFQPDLEWMSDNERRIERKAELLKTYIEAIEEQLQRIPEADLKPHQIGIPLCGVESFLGQIEAAKASIGLKCGHKK